MLNYRADIDGLRALAVTLVLFFHIELAPFTGGFVGVDVFFTISGFLITGIIVKQLEAGNFSFKQFYIRRAYRLLPAFIFLVIVVLLAGAVLLPPIAYSNLIESSLAAGLFISNFYFFFEQGGYFATASHELPLLHTWSLSVEEQFYLIMPLAFVLLYKISSSRLRLYLVIVCLLLAAVFAHLLTMWKPSIAYFFVGSRFAEFLIGSVLALLVHQRGQAIVPHTYFANVLFLFGTSMLVYSAFAIDKQTLFPGFIALIPCLATALIIYSGTNVRCLSHRLLGNRSLVFVGLLSYSLYLWHWPIVAFLKYYRVDFTASVQLMIVVASLIGAYISWRFVETRFRQQSENKAGKKAILLYVLPAFAIGALLHIGSVNSFFPERFESRVVVAEQAIKSMPDKARGQCHSKSFDDSLAKKCSLGANERAERQAFLWGDSHANHFSGFVDELGKAKQLAITDSTMGNCPPAIGLYVDTFGARDACVEKNKTVLEYILKTKPDEVYLAASWGGYFAGDMLSFKQQIGKEALVSAMVETVQQLGELGIQINILKMIPRMKLDNSGCYFKHELYSANTTIESCEFSNVAPQEVLNEVYLLIAKRSSYRVNFVDISDFICKNGECRSHLNQVPLYRDSNHLNVVGSRELAKAYLKKHVN